MAQVEMTAAPDILLTGRNGMVGTALATRLERLGRLTATGRSEIDLSDGNALADMVLRLRPKLIVNAAAYTAVDKAESDAPTAFAVNAEAPGILARAARKVGAALIHYSTDYVFDGMKPGRYVETDATNPLCVYGTSKLEGEERVRDALPESLILRTSWVFSAHGANFLKTMLRLARERDNLSVVADQFGAPTSASLIADVTITLAEKLLDKSSFPYGTYHLTAAGETSWHGYASYLIDYAAHQGFPAKARGDAIRAIPASDYPTPARRPANSRLDTGRLQTQFSVDMPHWQAGVRETIDALKAQGW